MLMWSASASMATMPAIALYLLLKKAGLKIMGRPVWCRALAVMGGGVFFVMLTENLWRKLFAPLFPQGGWCLAEDARAWCHVTCVVCSALLVGALLKLLPGFRRIL